MSNTCGLILVKILVDYKNELPIYKITANIQIGVLKILIKIEEKAIYYNR